MPKDARPKVKTSQTLFDKVLPQRLERLITAALAKLKNAWFQEDALTGIQFYGEIDE